MATNRPRITVTFEKQSDYDNVRELSELNGESMSSIVAGLVAAADPIITRIIRAGREFQAASEGLRADAIAVLEDAERDVVPHVDEMAQAMLAIFDQAAEAAAGTADPRLVTRGSRPPTSEEPPADQEPS